MKHAIPLGICSCYVHMTCQNTDSWRLLRCLALLAPWCLLLASCRAFGSIQVAQSYGSINQGRIKSFAKPTSRIPPGNSVPAFHDFPGTGQTCGRCFPSKADVFRWRPGEERTMWLNKELTKESDHLIVFDWLDTIEKLCAPRRDWVVPSEKIGSSQELSIPLRFGWANISNVD